MQKKPTHRQWLGDTRKLIKEYEENIVKQKVPPFGDCGGSRTHNLLGIVHKKR